MLERYSRRSIDRYIIHQLRDSPATCCGAPTTASRTFYKPIGINHRTDMAMLLSAAATPCRKRAFYETKNGTRIDDLKGKIFRLLSIGMMRSFGHGYRLSGLCISPISTPCLAGEVPSAESKENNLRVMRVPRSI